MKNFKNTLLKLHLSFNKEIIKLLGIAGVFAILGGVLAVISKSWIYLPICIAFGIFVVFYLINTYDSKVAKLNRLNIEEFVHLFSFFRIYIKNGFNVYNALKEITIFANPNLKELLENLINEIDNDKTVKPFVEFARNFDDIIVEEMMISIYQMIDDGEQSNYLNQFEMIFDKFSDILAEKNLKRKDSSLGTLSSAPLIGSCFLIITLTLGVIGILGDMINVL